MQSVVFISITTLIVTTLTYDLLVSGQNVYSSTNYNSEKESQSQTSSRFQSARRFESTFNGNLNNGPVVFADPDDENDGKLRNAFHPSSSDASNTFSEVVKKVPLNFLKKLSNYTDINIVFKDYVKNVAVKQLSNGNRYLADVVSGNPILGSNNQTIILSEYRPEEGSSGYASTHQPPGQGGLVRTPPMIVVRAGANREVPNTTTQFAKCQPESRTVELSLHFEPHIIYIPRCVRLNRCGGCCTTDLLNCEPITTEQVNIAVLTFDYIGDEKLNLQVQKTIPMEQHTQCECKCRVKKEDCTVKQNYVEDECQCVCRNHQDQAKCSQLQHKIWDPKTCECSCREIKDCNSGYIFSLKSCQCEVLTKNFRTGRKRRTQHQLHSTSLKSH